MTEATVVAALETTKALVHKLDQKLEALCLRHQDWREELAVLIRDVDVLGQTVESLNKTMHKGNGKEPLILQLRLLRVRQDQLEQRLQSLGKKRERSLTQRWQLWGIIASGVFSITAAALALLK